MLLHWAHMVLERPLCVTIFTLGMKDTMIRKRVFLFPVTVIRDINRIEGYCLQLVDTPYSYDTPSKCHIFIMCYSISNPVMMIKCLKDFSDEFLDHFWITTDQCWSLEQNLIFVIFKTRRFSFGKILE